MSFIALKDNKPNCCATCNGEGERKNGILTNYCAASCTKYKKYVQEKFRDKKKATTSK